MTMALVRQTTNTSWDVSTNSVSTYMQDVYDDAVKYFEQELAQDDAQRQWVRQRHSMSDVIQVAEQVQARYSTPTKSAIKREANRWTIAFSERIMHYQKVLDTLTQPFDYAALVWGATKFVLQGVLNHAELVVEFMRAMTEIGDALPRIDMNAQLYPTELMKGVVTRVYAAIMLFMQKAVKWYRMNTLQRMVSAIVKPWSLEHKVFLEQIKSLTATVDENASTAARLEVRDLTITLQAQDLKIAELQEGVHKLLEKAAQREQQIIEMLTIATNTRTLTEAISIKQDEHTARLCDMQFAQILKLLRPRRTPRDVLYACQSIAKRRQLLGQPTAGSHNLIERLNQWASASDSTMFIVHAGPRAEARTKAFALEVVGLLQVSAMKVIWFFSERLLENEDAGTSLILKTLVYQIMARETDILKNEPRALNIANFQRAQSDSDLADVLVFLLTRTSKYFLIIEFESLYQRAGHDKEWAEQLENVFQGIVDRVAQSGSIVKILLVSYRPSASLAERVRERRLTDVIRGSIIPLAKARKIPPKKRIDLARQIRTVR